MRFINAAQRAAIFAGKSVRRLGSSASRHAARNKGLYTMGAAAGAVVGGVAANAAGGYKEGKKRGMAQGLEGKDLKSSAVAGALRGYVNQKVSKVTRFSNLQESVGRRLAGKKGKRSITRFAAAYGLGGSHGTTAYLSASKKVKRT